MSATLGRINEIVEPLAEEEKVTVLEGLRQASSPGFDFFLLIILSATIATLGLLTDSAAVIIGAMLVAPLMSPILGVSIASITGDQTLFQRAATALVQGAFVAVLLATILSWFTNVLPFNILEGLPGEVLARTRPSPFDLIIALAGGGAASYALSQKQLSAALPGVAIATALMPPLCTIGIGVSLAEWAIAGGALLLFVTNLAAIGFAGIIVFFVLGFRPDTHQQTWRGLPRSLVVAAILVALVSIPLVALTVQFVQEAQQSQTVEAAVQGELAEIDGVDLVSLNWSLNADESIDMDLTVRSLSSSALNYNTTLRLQRGIATRLQRTVALVVDVIPEARLDPLVPPTSTPTLTPTPTNTAGPTPTPTATRTSTPLPTLTPSATPAPTNTPLPTATPTPLQAIVLLPDPTEQTTIELRRSPGGAILDTITHETRLSLLFDEVAIGDTVWVHVRLGDGREGWVISDVVAAVTATPTVTPTPEPAVVIIPDPTRQPSVAVRRSPAGPILEFVPNGQELALYFDEASQNRILWAHVQLTDGRDAWIEAQFVAIFTLTPSATPTATEAVTITPAATAGG